MITVGVLEAKNRLSWLLEQVSGGEEVRITRHGRPLARLVAEEKPNRERARHAHAELQRLRRETTLGGLSWKALRDEGRR